MGISWSSSRNGLGRTLIHSSNQNQPPSQFSDWTPPPMEIPGSSSCSGLRRRRIHSSNQNQYASQLTNWTPPPPPPPMEIPGSSSGSGLRRIVHSSHQNQHPSQLNDSSPLSPPSPPPEPMFRDYVNVRKRTLRLEVDEQNPDHLLISFVFDALFDGRFTIFYFVKEEPNCKFLPIIPEAYVPVKVPFQKGSGQKFRQPSGTGINLVFLELEELSTPSPQEGFFPLVISAETFAPADPIGESLTDPSLSSSPFSTHITQAVIHKNNENVFDVRVFKQLLWIFRARYELYGTYRIANSTAESFRDEDPGQVCVICLTEPVDTRVFPCGHMCMCGECAEEFRFQANKCPLCRQPATKVLVPVEAIRAGFI